MNRLFIELYLDEDVDVRLISLLRARGFDAISARDAEQLGKSDAEQLAYAVSHQKMILTHNRTDFEVLALEYFAARQTHYGIIVAVHRPLYELVRRLLPI